jgi:ABC-2 type transport system ATP-binding protein
LIRFIQYSKAYNDTLIISADLQLEHGLYWLKGENGSGKTTLLKSVAGLIPFSGQIEVAGSEINTDRIGYRHKVNYAEAEPLYPSFLTGTELLDFYIATNKASRAQASGLVDALGVGSYINNKIGTYSSGMVKKLSLVLAFVGTPSLILLDEPLITLDQQAVGNLLQLIEHTWQQGVSFLITSHQEFEFNGAKGTRLHIADRRLLVASNI